MDEVEAFVRLGGVSLRSPGHDVVAVDGQAKEVGRDEAHLGGAPADHADQHTVDGGDDPAMPDVPPDKDGGQNGEQARDVVEAEHCTS